MDKVILVANKIVEMGERRCCKKLSYEAINPTVWLIINFEAETLLNGTKKKTDFKKSGGL